MRTLARLRQLCVLILATAASCTGCKDGDGTPAKPPFHRITAEQLTPPAFVPPVAVHYDPKSGFVYAREVRSEAQLTYGGLTARLVTRLGKPDVHRRGYTYYVEEAGTAQRISVGLTAGWGLVFSAAPEQLHDGMPTERLEKTFTAFEGWLASAQPSDMVVEYEEDDDRMVRIGFEAGKEIDEELTVARSMDKLLELAREATAMHAPYSDAHEAQRRMMDVMAPIWRWHALDEATRRREAATGEKIGAHWSAQASLLLKEWDALSPEQQASEAVRVRFAIAARSLSEEGEALGLGDAALRKRIASIAATLPPEPQRR